jgi:hypothetical protein
VLGMKKLGVLGVMVGLGLGVAVAAPTHALAANETSCNNQTLGPVTVTGNLVVPAGAFCDLVGTHVTGNATAEAGPPEPSNPTGLFSDGAMIDGNVSVNEHAQFAAFDGSTIGGNVDCTKCEVADVNESTVKGNLEDNAITEGAFITNSQLGGNVHIHNGTDFFNVGFNVDGNTIGENLIFSQNTGSSDISGNTITQNLHCNDNTPPPSGGGNIANHKQGQCASL